MYACQCVFTTRSRSGLSTKVSGLRSNYWKFSLRDISIFVKTKLIDSETDELKIHRSFTIKDKLKTALFSVYSKCFYHLTCVLRIVDFELKDILVWPSSQNFAALFSRPTQCNQNRSVCWCVNDNGEVLPGTKQPTNQDTRHHCGKFHALYLSLQWCMSSPTIIWTISNTNHCRTITSLSIELSRPSCG